MSLTPYYQDKWATVYLGDCREILASIWSPVILTDPVWPNCKPTLHGSDDPQTMLSEMFGSIGSLPIRTAIHLGRDSDPRFLAAVPGGHPFFGVCWLEYARPHYKGRLMYGADVVYLFGEPPVSRPGAHVIPGRWMDPDSSGRGNNPHPCPRKLGHVDWIVKWWTQPGERIVDPFCGSGTVLVSAKRFGLESVGIEIDESYCEIAARRLEAETTLFDLAADKPTPSQQADLWKP